MELELEKYRSGENRTSLFHGIPIQFRNEILFLAKDSEVKIRLRYRGPRAHNKARGRLTNRGSCLLKDAKTLAVYLDYSK